MSTTAPSFPRLDRRDVWIGLIVTLLAAAAWSLFGFQGWLWRDDAVYLYAGQRFADGVPPYVSIFDHKTPLAPILAGLSIQLGRVFNLEDVLAARAGFLVISALSAGLIYLTGRLFLRSRWAGVFAAILFIGFWSFGREAVGGPQAKSPLVLFQVALFLFVLQRRFLAAGVAAALATWTWQPYLLFLLFGGVLSWTVQDGADRLRVLCRYAAGILIPSVPLFGYFIAKGAFGPLMEGAVFFNLQHLWRETPPALAWIELPVQTIFRGYASYSMVILLGLAVMIGIAVRRIGTLRRELVRDPASIIYLSLAFPILWSLMDFQGAADLYPFLPYVALGFAALLNRGLATLTSMQGQEPAWVRIGTFIVLLVGAVYPYHSTSETGLLNQRYFSQLIDQKYGAEAELLSIGLPEALVLRGQVNANRYVFVINGIDQLIDAATPGGFEAWLEDIRLNGPRLVALGPTDGPHSETLMEWLQSHYIKREFGLWTVYERKDDK